MHRWECGRRREVKLLAPKIHEYCIAAVDRQNCWLSAETNGGREHNRMRNQGAAIPRGPTSPRWKYVLYLNTAGYHSERCIFDGRLFRGRSYSIDLVKWDPITGSKGADLRERGTFPRYAGEGSR